MLCSCHHTQPTRSSTTLCARRKLLCYGGTSTNRNHLCKASDRQTEVQKLRMKGVLVQSAVAPV
jgi:hypothetical protein